MGLSVGLSVRLSVGRHLLAILLAFLTATLDRVRLPDLLRTISSRHGQSLSMSPIHRDPSRRYGSTLSQYARISETGVFSRAAGGSISACQATN
jgi:hypothetical protein